VKSGADDFFYPRDITEEELTRLKPREFKEFHGITPAETKKIRVVKAGDGSAHLIEAKFLEPEVHSIMELDSVSIQRKQLQHQVLLVGQPKRALKGTHVLKYIQWGEREGFDKGATVEGRRKTGRLWYDVIPEKRSHVLWSKAHQYRHIAFLNSESFVSNCRMYDVYPKEQIEDQVLCAVLNSTIVAMTKTFFGRFVGREGSLDTEVVDTKMMLAPDARLASKDVAKRLHSAVSSMRKRKALPLVDVDGVGNLLSSELALKDRQDLDDAVLELLGIQSAKEREALRAELYEAMTILYREIRATEKKMQKFRALTARRGRPSPQSIADEIWDTLETKPLAKSLDDFVPAHAATDSVLLPPGKAQLVTNDMFNPNSLRIGGQYVTLGSPERAAYALQLTDDEISGTVSIPRDATICKQALADYHAHTAELDQQFRAHIATFTADEQIQERVLKELWHRARQK
jgi:hypothetical protein